MLKYCHPIASGVSTVLLWSWHRFVHLALAVLLSWIPCRKLSNDNLCKIVQSRLSMMCSKLRTMDPRSPWWPPEQAAHYVPSLSPLAPKQPLNNEHWRMNLHSCRTYIQHQTLSPSRHAPSTTYRSRLTTNHWPTLCSPWYHQNRNREGPVSCQHCRWGRTDLQSWPAALQRPHRHTVPRAYRTRSTPVLII